MCRTSTISSAASPPSLSRTACATFEFPHLLEMVAEQSVRYGLSRALFLSVAHRRLEDLRRKWSRCLRRSEVADARRQPPGLRAARGQRRRGRSNRSVAELLREEAAAGVMRADFYRPFQGRAERIKDDALDVPDRGKARRKEGRRLRRRGEGQHACSTSPASSPDLIPYVVDRNPAKQSQFMPGSRIPIVPESRLIEDRPDIVVILPWNLKDELTKAARIREGLGRQFRDIRPRS